MLTIEGAQGEGGGQILRTSLTLSLATRTPFRIINIRAGRKKPGLLRQHLTAVQASLDGAAVGSLELTFAPRRIVPGEYRFSVGTAGSATLVLQAVLPVLLTAPARSVLTLEGGTHNPFAPPFDFLQRCFLPLINRMGPKVEARLMRPGFYPAGGGAFTVGIEPAVRLAGLELLERGEVVEGRATAMVSRVPRNVAERELAVIGGLLEWSPDRLRVEENTSSPGPGNVVSVEVESELITEMFTGFGQRGVKAEAVAKGVVREVRRYLEAGVPVGEHLADQLLLPLALAGAGRFKSLAPTPHARTNIEVIKRFLDLEIAACSCGDRAWLFELKRSPAWSLSQ